MRSKVFAKRSPQPRTDFPYRVLVFLAMTVLTCGRIGPAMPSEVGDDSESSTEVQTSSVQESQLDAPSPALKARTARGIRASTDL